MNANTDLNSPALAKAETQHPPKTPRWVKIVGLVVLLLFLAVGIMLLSGGQHGPGMHMSHGATTEVQATPAEVEGNAP